MRVDIEIRGGISGGDMKGAMDKAIFATSEQALKDCNYFCKQDMGALILSSVIHSSVEAEVIGQHGIKTSDIPAKQLTQAMASQGSDLEKGVLRWVMPYAEAAYKCPTTYTDKNTNAVPEWCQRAESDYGDQWQAVFKRAHEREIHR